ncbi:outer membrane beta-barrel protein [Rudanella lutea]|uniref:outer membrane beta-barrel protein n=1 Tax=Rudanella lutea TaxID=451374 RepID=UPI00037196CD|nr:outer membrane beta-barrel protein [Rudanella lutea]
MKRLNGLILTGLLMSLTAINTIARHTADSLIVQFANQTRIVIYGPNREAIKNLSSYDLNKIVREMGMKLDSVPNGQTSIRIEGKDGDRYLRDTVIVITRGKDGKQGEEGGIRIIVRRDGKTASDSNQVDKEYKIDRLRKKRSDTGDWRVKTDILVGLNTLIIPAETGLYDPALYELRPIGSRFVGISFGQRPTLIKGKRARLSIHYALEINWNNFMFDNPVTPVRGQSRVEFANIQEPIDKTKLTVCNLQLPVVPRLSVYNQDGRKVFHFGAGAYAGYRVDSYSMIKYGRRDKDRDHDRFFLNDLRYGLMAHLGILKTNLFVKYDLTPLFQTEKGPQARALSFGISL